MGRFRWRRRECGDGSGQSRDRKRLLGTQLGGSLWLRARLHALTTILRICIPNTMILTLQNIELTRSISSHPDDVFYSSEGTHLRLAQVYVHLDSDCIVTVGLPKDFYLL